MAQYNWIKIKETPEWIIDYDKNKGRYRISYFEYGHFVDEIIFCEYRASDVETLISCPHCLVHSISIADNVGNSKAICKVCGTEVDLLHNEERLLHNV